VKVTPVTKAADVRKRLLMLIDECQSFQWATAWASESEVLDAALESNKMTSMVIGTHQYFTAPEVLDKCSGICKVRVMHPKGPMFHPKLYAFNLGNRVEVFVGSSNLTMGGLAKNIECGVFLNDELHSHPLQDLTAHVQALWKNAKELDDDFIASYKANYRRVRNAKKELEDFVEIKKPKRSDRSANDIDPQEMDWSTFLELVNADTTHGSNERLKVLSQARQLFAKTLSFADLDEVERKCIAGILKPATRNGVDWGFFGQMSAFGSYSPILQTHARLFSIALDHIPLQGEVRREHYDAYLTAFKKIPGASETWTGMGTRLLAMKRPDYFVCIDNANRDGLCNYFSSAPTTTNLDNYWNRIIAPMMITPWWQSDMPDDKLEQAIWMGRAAMLDAIYYDPKRR
jgi:HKD family nuclease